MNLPYEQQYSYLGLNQSLTITENPKPKRSLLSFFGGALHWLMGMGTMKDTAEIKQQVNLLIQGQTQQKTLVHIISILNVKWYAIQVNRQKLNEVMNALQKANEDMNILFNTTDALLQHLRYHQIYTYANTILAYLRSLSYMSQVTTHTINFVDAVTTNIPDILPPDILPVEKLKTMCRHIEVQLPSIMHLSISSDNIFNIYWYMTKHVLVAGGEFLLLIDVPIQDRAQQLQIFYIFKLLVPHGDVSAKYEISNKHTGITYDDTQVVMITEQQYSTCLHANGQFCKIDAPFQTLTNMHNAYQQA